MGFIGESLEKAKHLEGASAGNGMTWHWGVIYQKEFKGGWKDVWGWKMIPNPNANAQRLDHNLRNVPFLTGGSKDD